ncbi:MULTISPECIES: hypothetical protein [Streptosporangium]|uniref:O-methyltransferase involved in polyketide biosynthesis n=1 Tax=Streptosporangium brasiliense TaxID=47480 RepID=A0ABT9RJ59_9ACTN|nr:hypothetical protein [Streptosporangium brasiliense]MDP9869338.1 O-methyltransferase involved in polyketide biosynthesis [Streptosporangium brasiliense]
MNAEKVDFTGIGDEGITWTLLGTHYIRAYESRLPAPILADRHAARTGRSARR